MAVVRFDALRTKAFGSITGSYTTLGSALTVKFRMVRVVNNTDADLLISLDGTTDNLILPAGSFVLYDCSTNSPNVGDTDGFVMQIGSQFYVKYNGSAPTSGDVWVEGVYARGV